MCKVQRAKCKGYNRIAHGAWRTAFIGFFPFAMLYALCPMLFASDIQFEVSVDRKVVSLGESLQLNLTFHGTQNVPGPDIREIDGFQVRYLGPSTRMSIVNGRVSTSITHIYTLMPLKTGTFQIGPFSVSYQGETFSSEPITIEVVSGPSPPKPGVQEPGIGEGVIREEQLKDRIFLTIEAGKTELYVNEPMPLSIKLYIDRLAVRDIQYPKFEHESFSVKEFGQPRQYRQNIGGILYDVIEFNTGIFAVRPGESSLGPASIDCNLMVQKRDRRRRSAFDDDFFGGFFGDDIFDDFFGRYETYPIKITSLPLVITAKPLPEEGKPAHFRGAIGDFRLEAEASPKEVKAGDPVTLTMRISGEGNFDTISSPFLDTKEGIKVYQPQAKEEAAAKVFEQVLIPQSENVSEIPKITFSFFDPKAGIYRTITKGPFPITVTRPEAGELKIVEMPQAITRIPEKEHLGRDIVYIKESSGKLQPIARHLHQRSGYWLYQFIVLISFISFMVFHRHKERLKTDQRYARRLAAPAKARKGIARARQFLKQEKNTEFFDAVHKTMQEYLADKFHLPPGGITVDTVKESLGAKGIGEGMLGRIAGIFNACDMARYAPLEFDRERRESLFNDMCEVINSLERIKV